MYIYIYIELYRYIEAGLYSFTLYQQPVSSSKLYLGVVERRGGRVQLGSRLAGGQKWSCLAGGW